MTQPSLFGDADDAGPKFGAYGRRSATVDVAFPPLDPGVTDDGERVRLSNQCQDILDRLRRGPATNRELAAISLKYTGRLSDLRAAGYAVKCVEQDRKTGLSVYQLFEEPTP